jgi:hypothetical protein
VRHCNPLEGFLLGGLLGGHSASSYRSLTPAVRRAAG